MDDETCRLYEHFEGAAELREQYAQLDADLNRVVEKFNLHCKDGCGACCHGAATNKEASMFELLPMAIDIELRGETDDVLQRLLSVEDCSQIPCVNFVSIDEAKGLGHCGRYLYRPFVCRLFGDSLYEVKENYYEYTGCKWLKNKYMHNDNSDKIKAMLPKIAETVMKGRCLNETSFETITNINTALRDALEIVRVKHDLLNDKLEE